MESIKCVLHFWGYKIYIQTEVVNDACHLIVTDYQNALHSTIYITVDMLHCQW